MSFNPVTGSSTIAGDSDVALSSVANQDGLVYNTTTSKWQNLPVASQTDLSDSQQAAISSANQYTDTKEQQNPITIYYGSGSVPARTAYTTDVTRVVFWIGQTQPTIGGSTGAVNNLDIWFRTP